MHQMGKRIDFFCRKMNKKVNNDGTENATHQTKTSLFYLCVQNILTFVMPKNYRIDLISFSQKLAGANLVLFCAKDLQKINFITWKMF